MSTLLVLKYILYFLELCTCIVGFLSWDKIKSTYWKYFPFFMGVIVLVELCAQYLAYNNLKQWNIDLYSYFGLPVQFLFYIWLFYNKFKNTKHKNLPIIGAIIYLLSWLIEIFYFKGTNNIFMSFSYSIGNIVLLVLILRFFIDLIVSDEVLNYKHNRMFWVALGLLIFFLGTFPYYAFINIGNQYAVLFNYYYYLSFVLNYLMYTFFIVAFIWGKQQ